MASSRENVEEKLSSDTVLSYTLPTQFTGAISTLPEGEQIGIRLEQACAEGDLKTVKEVLETNNLSVNVKLLGYRTPLMVAAKNNQLRLVNFLLNQPGINVSLTEQDGGTALSFALQMWNNFEGANYEIARRLVDAGADINQVTFHNTVLLTAWLNVNQAAANTLVVLLRANINASAHLFNSNPHILQIYTASKNVPSQIELSRQHLHEYVNSPKFLGIELARLSLTLHQDVDLDLQILPYLFPENSLEMRAFNVGCGVLRQRGLRPLLPVLLSETKERHEAQNVVPETPEICNFSEETKVVQEIAFVGEKTKESREENAECFFRAEESDNDVPENPDSDLEEVIIHQIMELSLEELSMVHPAPQSPTISPAHNGSVMAFSFAGNSPSISSSSTASSLSATSQASNNNNASGSASNTRIPPQRTTRTRDVWAARYPGAGN